MAKKQKSPVRHHYVPAFLLSNFTANDGRLWVYDTERKRSWPGCPESAGYEKHWHTVVRKGGVKDTSSIENIVTERYDTPGSDVVRRLLNGEQLSPTSSLTFRRFVASLMLRSPRSVRQMTEVGTAILSESTSRIAAYNHEFRARVSERLQQAGNSIEVIEACLNDLAQGRTACVPRHEFALIMNLKGVEPLTLQLADLNWRFCFLPESEEDFFIGDHPVLLEDVGPSAETGHLGIANPDIRLILPLSKRMAAVASRSCTPGYGTFQPGMSSMINRQTLLWSERFIYAGLESDSLLQTAIELSAQRPKVFTERIVDGKRTVIVSTLRQDKKGG